MFFLLSRSMFRENTGSAFSVRLTNIYVLGNVVFANNTGKNGGAIALFDSSMVSGRRSFTIVVCRFVHVCFAGQTWLRRAICGYEKMHMIRTRKGPSKSKSTSLATCVSVSQADFICTACQSFMNTESFICYFSIQLLGVFFICLSCS